MSLPFTRLPHFRAQAIGFCFFALLLACVSLAFARDADSTNVLFTAGPGAFPIVHNTAAPIFVDAQDWPGVIRAAGDLQADIKRVTAIEPKLTQDRKSLGATAIIVGTLGRSATIDQLAHDQKIDVSQIKDRWESYSLETVADPLPGITSALVIAGSDKRGTIYGIYDHLARSASHPGTFGRTFLSVTTMPCSSNPAATSKDLPRSNTAASSLTTKRRA